MANEQRNGRNGSDDQRSSYRSDDEADERFRDDRSRWDRDDDRSIGWRGIDRGGQGQSGYGAGRQGDPSWQSSNRGYPSNWEERPRERGQSGQPIGSHWGNEMGHARGDMGSQGSGYNQPSGQGFGQHSGAWNPQGSQWTQHQQSHQYNDNFYGQGRENYGGTNYGQAGWNRNNMSMGQPGTGSSYNQGHQPGYGFVLHGGPQHHHNNSGPQNYGQPYGAGGMGLGQQGQPNYGHGYEGHEEDHPSLGQRIKDWFSGHRGKGPSGYARSDERIRESVCEALSEDDRVDATFVDVAVENGEVTLTGTVENRHTKRLAEDCIENLSGVRDVHNHIRVMDRSRVAGTTGATTMTSSLGSSGMKSNTAGTTTVSGSMKDDTTTGQNGSSKRDRM